MVLPLLQAFNQICSIKYCRKLDMLVFSIHKWRLPQNSNHQSPTSYPNLSPGWIFYSGSSFYLGCLRFIIDSDPEDLTTTLTLTMNTCDSDSLTLIAGIFPLKKLVFYPFFIFAHKFSFFIVWHWLSQSLLEKLPRLGKSWTRKARIISIMLL